MGDKSDREMKKPSFLYPVEKYNLLVKYADEKGESYPVSYIISEACDQYIEGREHPETLVKKMQDELRRDPSILKNYIQTMVKEEVHAEFRRVFGERYHS